MGCRLISRPIRWGSVAILFICVTLGAGCCDELSLKSTRHSRSDFKLRAFDMVRRLQQQGDRGVVEEIVDGMREQIKLSDSCGVIVRGSASSASRWAVLLAGGDGTRLRDLTRRISGDSRPKQFCQLFADRSLFEQTRERIDPLFPRNRQVPVLSRAHEKYFAAAFAQAAESWALVQPANRGTGIAIALASLYILSFDPEATVSVFPCDHYYSDEESFRATILSAEDCAEGHPDTIVLVGAQAEYPESEYGWIEPGAVVSQTGAGPLCHVKRFWEKPHQVQAAELMRVGCLWNTFVTVGRASTFLELMLSQAPQAVILASQALANLDAEGAYDQLPTVDFSRDVLVKESKRLLVLRDGCSGWADLGSPPRVLETLLRNGIQPEWASEKTNFSIVKQPAVFL
jgi:mannose-1-phosphate guanylyltransferase